MRYRILTMIMQRKDEKNTKKDNDAERFAMAVLTFCPARWNSLAAIGIYSSHRGNSQLCTSPRNLRFWQNS